MIYAMSDLHGCYKEYKRALELIQFSDEDLLYVLGDIVDRGNGSMQILMDMMSRENVIPLIGNHEYMALTVLNNLWVEIREDNISKHLNVDEMESYYNWMVNGGDKTLQGFRKLSRGQQQDILEYLEDFALYEEINVQGEHYILVHGSFEPFDKKQPLSDYLIENMLWRSPNYEKVYFENAYLVTGHRPTLLLKGEEKGRILEKNRHIAIDCGCVFGGRLGIYCFDTHEKWYVERGKVNRMNKK